MFFFFQILGNTDKMFAFETVLSIQGNQKDIIFASLFIRSIDFVFKF